MKIRLKPGDYLPISVVSAVAFFVTAVWCAAMAFSVAEMYGRYDSSAEGTITDNEYRDTTKFANSKSHGYFEYNAQFEVNGEIRTVDFSDKGAFRKNIGDKVTVLYMSNKPEDCMVSDMLVRDTAVAAILAAVTLTCSVIFFIKHQKTKDIPYDPYS